MQFRVFIQFFSYGFSQKKIHVTKKTSSLFLMTCKYKTHLCKFRSREETTRGRHRVSRLRYMTRTGTHADYDQAKKLVLTFVLESKAFLR